MATEFNTYNRSNLESLQKELIFRKGDKRRGSQYQREFLGLMIEDRDQWITKFERLYVSSQKISKCPMQSQRLSEREFVNPPFSTEREIATLLKDLPRKQAAQPEFWTHYTIEMIKSGRICITNLAAQRTVPSQTGCDRIRAVLDSADSTGDQVDSCIRTVFRNLGGIYSDRAKRTTYIDCPTSRAWWRHNFALEYVESGSWSVELQQVSDALRTASWEALIEGIVSRMTVIGASNIRNVLIHYMTQKHEPARQFRKIIDAVGKRCTVQMLATLPISILKNVLENEIIPTSKSKTVT